MFSKRKVRLTALAAVTLATSSALFLYMTPAATSVNPAPVESAPAFASEATIEPWSTYLSRDAVDSNGIELDLDGNASALIPSR